MSKKVDMPRQPAETTDLAIPVSQSTTALEPAPASGGFDGLDRVEMAPMTAAEERAERRARRAEADFVRTEARRRISPRLYLSRRCSREICAHADSRWYESKSCLRFCRARH
jgi:hypothetical protein